MAKGINTELLARVRDHILEEPRRYDQTTFGEASEDAPCGTAACIAGWAAHLSGRVSLKKLRAPMNPVREIRQTAQRALGLTDEEARVLFTGDPTPCWCGDKDCALGGWPPRFGKRYEKAKTARGRASAAAAYIDHIIATGKVTD